LNFQMKEKRLLLSTSTSTSTTAAQCVGQTVDLALFNNQMHFEKNFLYFTLRESSIISCGDVLYFKDTMHRKNKHKLFHVDASWCFRKPNTLINQQDLNRPNAISTVSWVL